MCALGIRVVATAALISLGLAARADAAEINPIWHRATLDKLGKAVRDAGYECPRLAEGYDRGDTKWGQKFHLYCGPTSGGVDQRLRYQAILTDDNRFIVDPLEMQQLH